jgi:DnaJ-class molecular chaperone
MMLCNECNNSGFCAWCKGTGKEGLALVCRSCYGSGMCLSCSNLKFEKRPVPRKVQYDTMSVWMMDPLLQDGLDGFEDINFIIKQRAL